MELLRKWMNVHMALHESMKKPIERHEMVQFLSFMLFSDLCGICVDKALHVLSLLDCDLPRGDRMKYILINLLVFPLTDRGHTGYAVWFTKRDATQRLETMKKCAYEMSQCVFFLQPIRFLQLTTIFMNVTQGKIK